MITDIILILLSLGIILISCFIFVNAIELFGKTFDLHQGIIGSILAAIGTALPETIIPILAILFAKGSRAHAIGIGAIAGAPFMLATLGFFVTGAAVLINTSLKKRSFAMYIDRTIISRDLTFFFIYYGIAISATLYRDIHPLKLLVAIALVFSYAIYLKITIHGSGEDMEAVEPLYLTRFFKLSTSFFSITLQLAGSLVLIVAGAHVFINYLDLLARTLGASPLLLSLIITPIATELPEKMNSVIWIGKKKDTLALGNITGGMVFQSCFPVAFGMVFTEWNLRGLTLVSALCALLMTLFVLFWIKIRKSLHPGALLAGGALYGVFLLGIILKMR
jgi:cation:H+ antiporter